MNQFRSASTTAIIAHQKSLLQTRAILARENNTAQNILIVAIPLLVIFAVNYICAGYAVSLFIATASAMAVLHNAWRYFVSRDGMRQAEKAMARSERIVKELDSIK